jgi:hypothetical protein
VLKITVLSYIIIKTLKTTAIIPDILLPVKKQIASGSGAIL